MKILWHGVKAGLSTGYSNQTELFTRAIEDLDHEIAINNMVDQYVTQVDGNGIVHFATGPKGEMMGNDLIPAHVDRWKPDIVISMCDPFMCKPELFERFAWYPFVMVDSEPLVWMNKEVLKACRRPIAPTQNAMEVLIEAGFDPLYCPLAIDNNVYKPMDKAQARKDMSKVWNVDLSGKFLAVMNSANHGPNLCRKNFAAALKAWSIFNNKNPNAVLYIHTDQCGTLLNGDDLNMVMKLYGCKNVIFAPQYEYFSGTINTEYLMKMYNAADVFLHTSRGEGFGIPIIEAQACGCPVIVPDFGAMAENCFQGIPCSGHRFMYHPGTEQFLVNPDEVAKALGIVLHGSTSNLADIEMSDEIQQFHIDKVRDNHLKPMLEEIADAEKKRRKKESRHCSGAGK